MNSALTTVAGAIAVGIVGSFVGSSTAKSAHPGLGGGKFTATARHQWQAPYWLALGCFWRVVHLGVARDVSGRELFSQGIGTGCANWGNHV
jgi:hypothetical protein